MLGLAIRPARLADVDAIAHIHIEGWRTTYRGIMPDAFLAALSVEERAEKRRRQLADPSSPSFTLVAEADGQLAGFAVAGPSRAANAHCPQYPAELYALYLLASHHRRGLGRALVAACAARLVSQGHAAMLVWVAAQNPATRFYEALGGRRFSTRTEAFGGLDIEELAYGYDDLRALIGATLATDVGST